jgi:hypothetical protein
VAVRANHHLRFWNEDGLIETDSETLGDALSPADWAAHAAGEGTKGLRLYDLARIRLPWLCDAQWERWVLIRRNRRDPAKQAYYLVFAHAGTTLAELAGVAGLRWTLEECFRMAMRLGIGDTFVEQPSVQLVIFPTSGRQSQRSSARRTATQGGP